MRLGKVGDSSPSNGTASPTVSVIIPAYRAGATLPQVLLALEPQVRGRDREAILVDSSGGSRKLAEEWPWVQVRTVPQRILPGRARNLGVTIAQADLLAFLDADTIPEPGWLDELVRALAPGLDMVAGAVLDGTPDSPWGSVGYMLEFLEWVPERALPIRHAAGCNLLMRRTAFDRAGGFPEDLWPGEDTVLTVPFGARGTLAFAPAARVTHLNRTGLRSVLAHQRRLGASWVEVCARVAIPGRSLGAPRLAALAVLGRLYALIFQLRCYPRAYRRLVRHGPRFAAALVAWGVGVSRPAAATWSGSARGGDIR